MKPDPTSLDRLHDVIAPPPVPWWPPAPGWYWVLGFVLVVILVLVLRFFIHWQRNRYRREALAELARYQAAGAAGQRVKVIASLAGLLKRTALSAWPRTQVAALNGPDWFAFLNRTGGAGRFGSGAGALLEGAAYDSRQAQSLDDAQTAELVELVRHWLKHHRAETHERSGN